MTGCMEAIEILRLLFTRPHACEPELEEATGTALMTVPGWAALGKSLYFSDQRAFEISRVNPQ